MMYLVSSMLGLPGEYSCLHYTENCSWRPRKWAYVTLTCFIILPQAEGFMLQNAYFKIESCKLFPKDGVDWVRMSLHNIVSKSKSPVPFLHFSVLVPKSGFVISSYIWLNLILKYSGT